MRLTRGNGLYERPPPGVRTRTAYPWWNDHPAEYRPDVGRRHDRDRCRQRATTVAVFVTGDGSAGSFGIRAAAGSARFKVPQPFAKAYEQASGPSGKGVATGLTVRHDNGSQDIGHDFRDEIV